MLPSSAKYPLAIVKKILDVFGPNFSLGYDIACAFWKTLMDSILGAKAREHGLHMVVGSFHGHAHNRGCQVNWHPLYVDGMGQADFEGCERIFESSNGQATATRHASKFHRIQAIEEHFRFWDEDKYAALSMFDSCYLCSPI
jgi:Kyakuja-Dileera-Zisupton transposase